MDSGESIGMMAGAYFVGRAQLLRWINDLTGLNYSKIEQTASGVFACHVFDALFPGTIRLEKVKFNAKHQYEFVHNYKVLQAAFNRNKMKKQIEVEKLMKGKYQDNLEFIQWIKAFYDMHASDEAIAYDGRLRREEILSKTPGSQRPALATNRPRPNEPTRPVTKRPVRPQPVRERTKPTVPTVTKAVHEQLQEDYDNLEAQLGDAETERNFYFNKLRQIEVIVQTAQEDINDEAVSMEALKSFFDEIKDTLYSEEDTAQPAEEQDAEYGAETAEPLEEEPYEGEELVA